MTQFSPLTPEKFSNRSWLRPQNYAFAANNNLIPVVAAELSQLVANYPLCFVEDGGKFQLMAMTAIAAGTNFFVTPDGNWMSSYIPAALRTYPFRLARTQSGGAAALCFDEDSGLLAEAGQGEPFFDEAGGPAPTVKALLELLGDVERSRLQTQQAVDALHSAGVIRPWPLTVLSGGAVATVEGLYRVAEDALNALPDEAFIALRRVGALPLAYAQLLSMGQVDLLRNAAALQRQLQGQQAATAAGPAVE